MGVGIGRERQFAEFAPEGVVVAAIAAVAFLVAACGGGGGSAGGPAAVGGSTVYQHALAFAQCMRSHGVPGFPDPNSRGEILEQGSMGGSAAQNAAAQRACLHLLGGQNTPVQTRQQLGQALQFATCMRSHGDPNFPDPSVRQGGVVLHMIGADSPQGQAVVQTCERLTHYAAE
jgi:hypothetical protein